VDDKDGARYGAVFAFCGAVFLWSPFDKRFAVAGAPLAVICGEAVAVPPCT